MLPDVAFSGLNTGVFVNFKFIEFSHKLISAVIYYIYEHEKSDMCRFKVMNVSLLGCFCGRKRL